MAVLSRGFPLAGLQAIVGGVGLFFLPDQQNLVFAMISGVLGFLLCKGLFEVGLLAMVLVMAYRERIGSSKG